MEELRPFWWAILPPRGVLFLKVTPPPHPHPPRNRAWNFLLNSPSFISGSHKIKWGFRPKAVTFPNLLNISSRWGHRNFCNRWKARPKKSWGLGLTQAHVCSCGGLWPHGFPQLLRVSCSALTRCTAAGYTGCLWFRANTKALPGWLFRSLFVVFVVVGVVFLPPLISGAGLKKELNLLELDSRLSMKVRVDKVCLNGTMTASRMSVSWHSCFVFLFF